MSGNSIWVGHEKHPGYLFSPEGHCLSTRRGIPKILKARIKNGYVQWRLHNKDFLAHRIIADIYCPKKIGGVEVNHKDGVKTNNSYKNLEWVSKKENMRHSVKSLMKNFDHRRGSRSNFAKLTEGKVKEIKRLINSGARDKEIAKKFMVSSGAIGLIKKQKTWRHVD